MIEVNIYRDINGSIRGFRVSGHADFAQKGSDIVCSAVSFLIINTINSIENFTGEKTDVTADEEKGLIECYFPGRKSGASDKDADLLIKSMIFGLEELEKQYGGYIKISEEAPK